MNEPNRAHPSIQFTRKIIKTLSWSRSASDAIFRLCIICMLYDAHAHPQFPTDLSMRVFEKCHCGHRIGDRRTRTGEVNRFKNVSIYNVESIGVSLSSVDSPSYSAPNSRETFSFLCKGNLMLNGCAMRWPAAGDRERNKQHTNFFCFCFDVIFFC